jgi:hypothetical protein
VEHGYMKNEEGTRERRKRVAVIAAGKNERY